MSCSHSHTGVLETGGAYLQCMNMKLSFMRNQIKY